MIGLKFLFELSFFTVVLSEKDAFKIINQFQEGKLEEYIGGYDGAKNKWAVRTSLIRCVHTVPITDVPAGPIPGLASRYMSGQN